MRISHIIVCMECHLFFKCARRRVPRDSQKKLFCWNWRVHTYIFPLKLFRKRINTIFFFHGWYTNSFITVPNPYYWVDFRKLSRSVRAKISMYSDPRLFLADSSLHRSRSGPGFLLFYINKSEHILTQKRSFLFNDYPTRVGPKKGWTSRAACAWRTYGVWSFYSVNTYTFQTNLISVCPPTIHKTMRSTFFGGIHCTDISRPTLQRPRNPYEIG